MKGKPPANDRGTGWVVAQFTLMLAGLAAGPVWRSQWSSGWTWALGGVFLLVGALAGIRGERDLGRHRTPFPRPKDDGQLIITGIYGVVRHPLYLAVMSLGFAWAFLWCSAPALVLAILQVPFFDAKARYEEQWLRERYSDYAEYERRVSRFLPGLY